MMKMCKKNLHKSTYQSLAFKRGQKYEVVSEDFEFVFLKDEKGNDFNFAKEERENNVYYLLNDYFV